MSARENAQAAVGAALKMGADKAAAISRPAVLRHIEQTRRSRPEASPADVIKLLGRRFTAAVATTGTVSGASAVVPGVTTPASVALAVADAGTFTAAAGLYTLALAEVHGIPVHDLERRRTLLLGVLLGDAGSKAINKAVGRTGPHWARKVVTAIPMESIHAVNKVLGQNFVTKYGTKQGILVLGKQVPLGIGGAIGGTGNAVFARFTIKAAARAFGPAPAEWPSHITAQREEAAQDEAFDAAAHTGDTASRDAARDGV